MMIDYKIIHKRKFKIISFVVIKTMMLGRFDDFKDDQHNCPLKR